MIYSVGSSKYDQILEADMTDKKKKQKLLDTIGIGCGVLLVLIAVISIIVSKLPASAGVKDKEIPSTALTLEGTAPGRNGDVTVRVVADENMLYQIKVIDQQETQGIGSEAVKRLPASIFQAQSLKVDAVSGATISSEAIKTAIISALESGGIKPAIFGGSLVKVETVAQKVETHSGAVVQLATDWSEQYPDEYATWAQNSENSEATDYLVDYPMLKTLYEPYGFSKDYKSARGHMFAMDDILETKRIGEKSKASCWTCKTPQFTNLVNEEGVGIYSLPFMDVRDKVIEPISCYTCHANTPGTLVVTQTFLTDGVGEDFEGIDAATLSCGQCHNEYFFATDTGATTLPHNSLSSMSPDAILAYYNDGSNFSTGEPFYDYVNPRTGVKQIKVQHPELETFLGEGSQHRNAYTCADCHMGKTVSESGRTFSSHYLISPLDNPELIENECSKCHVDLVAEVRASQEAVERRTYAIGYELQFLTERLAAAVESGEYSEAELDAIRALARDAQFYWDFVFVENAEGAHNPTLTHECLDKAEALCNEALGLFKAA